MAKKAELEHGVRFMQMETWYLDAAHPQLTVPTRSFMDGYAFQEVHLPLQLASLGIMCPPHLLHTIMSILILSAR